MNSLLLFSISASTETTTRPGTVNIRAPPGQRHDLVSSLNRTNIDNYSARNPASDNGWSDMFGDVQTAGSTEQENIPPNFTLHRNDRTANENTEETVPMDTVQYQLPSTENIAQHRYFREQNSKVDRTGSIIFFLHVCSS